MTTTLDRPAPAPTARPTTTPGVRCSPQWTRPAVLVLLGATALLYLWNLAATGWGNSFYAAAVQAGSQSWKALLFGSLDAGNAITVDKPPVSLWVMGLSARVFGFSSWSLLVPQALEGVAAVGLLYLTVKRHAGAAAGLLAGAALALTPVATLMFRYDLPDALLVLLLVAGAYAVSRAVEKASPYWLALAATALGFAFLTKMLQALLVLPAFALVYLVAAPTSPLRRVRDLLVAGAALVVSAGWFVALVALWPAGSRPYIGGSTDNSLLQLALGYNGLNRVLGDSTNGGMGGNTSAGFGGATGIGRLFGTSMGTEISWLLPAAVIALAAGLWFTRAAPRTDRTRAALLLWGGWLVVTGGVFSYMAGIAHPYYTVALAPAVAALVAIGASQLWRARHYLTARLTLAAMLAATAAWNAVLLARTPTYLPGLRWAVLVVGLVAAVLIALDVARGRRAATVLAGVALVAGLAAPAAYSLTTAATVHSGSIPTSGPSGGTGGGPGGGAGGPGAGTTTGTALTTLLAGTTTRWAAATAGATTAADLELASGRPVIAIGGWNGSDPSPTLAEFQRYVATGQVRYYITGGQGGGPGGGNSSIASWVAAHYTATTVGGRTVYDLATPAS